MNEESIFIRILRLGEEAGLSGIDDQQFKEWALEQSEINSTHDMEFTRARKLFQECFDMALRRTGQPSLYILKNEYYFRLIEFQELQESRQASTSANRNAFIAIGVSILAIIASAFTAYTQITAPISINDVQFSQLESAATSPDMQKIELSDEQLNKLLTEFNKTNGNLNKLITLHDLNKSKQQDK